MESISPSRLRANIYRILDRVVETGKPIEIVRGGRRLRLTLVAGESGSKLSRLERRPRAISGDPGDLVEIDWSKEWRP